MLSFIVCVYVLASGCNRGVPSESIITEFELKIKNNSYLF